VLWPLSERDLLSNRATIACQHCIDNFFDGVLHNVLREVRMHLCSGLFRAYVQTYGPDAISSKEALVQRSVTYTRIGINNTYSYFPTFCGKQPKLEGNGSLKTDSHFSLSGSYYRCLSFPRLYAGQARSESWPPFLTRENCRENRTSWTSKPAPGLPTLRHEVEFGCSGNF